MWTLRRPFRRTPVLRLEELSRRDVWSVSGYTAVANFDPLSPQVVVYDVAFAAPASLDAGAAQAVTFYTPDGVARPASLSYQGGQLVGHLEQDFSLANSSVVTIRVSETTPTYERYRDIALLLTAQAGDWQSGGINSPSAGDGAGSFPGAPVNQFPIPMDAAVGTLSVIANKPLQLVVSSVHVGLEVPPPGPPVVAVPPLVASPPPPAVQTSPAVPPPGAQQAPPAVEGPPVPPPARVDPPRPPVSVVTPLFLASSQIDHLAGAYVPTGAAVREYAAGDALAVHFAGLRGADRLVVVPWTTPSAWTARAFADEFDRRPRIESSDAVVLAPAAPSARSPSRTNEPGEVRSARFGIDVEATIVEEIVVLGTDQSAADAVLLRLAARPLPVPSAPADASAREKKPARLLSAFTVLVMSGVCVRWFRARPRKTPAERTAGEWAPPLL